MLEKVRRNSQSTARAFVELFLEEVWKPFDREGRPDERWAEITESIEGLRPLASDAVLAIFRQVHGGRDRGRVRQAPARAGQG